MRYANFDVRIRRGTPYQVRVTSPGGEAHGTFHVPPELKALLPKPPARKRGRRHVVVDSVDAAPGRIGLLLFEALFTGEVRERLSISFHVVRHQHKGLRIRLWLADVPELAGLPWERLRDPKRDQPLALSVRTPIVRYLELPEPAPPIPADPPLRVLVVSANPPDVCQLDLDRESLLLAQSLSRLTSKRRAVIDHLQSATLSALVEQLSSARYHVLHFMGHGELGEEGGTLLFEDGQGRSSQVPFHQLAALLDGSDLRLIVLNACEGARSSGMDPFDGVAQSLVRKGIPAVVAMQLPVSDEAALHFTRTFYRSLADGQPVEVAITEARRMIYAGERSTEWATPVLYTRSEDGRIIDSPSAWRWPLAAALALLMIILAGVAVIYRPQHSTPPIAPNPSECPSPRNLNMAFVLIKPGSFLLKDEKDGAPVRRVEISKPFCLGAYEVTREQWARGLGEGTEHVTDARLPAGGITWSEAHVFLSRLNQKESTRVYRLPTDEEWEYAVRAGTPTTYFFGDDAELLHRYGNCSRGDGFDGPAPVASFQRNPWGLYDMYGNVWEWVGGEAGPHSGEVRVRRGGSWSSGPQSCSSGHRSLVQADRQVQENGFRIVLELP